MEVGLLSFFVLWFPRSQVSSYLQGTPIVSSNTSSQNNGSLLPISLLTREETFLWRLPPDFLSFLGAIGKLAFEQIRVFWGGFPGGSDGKEPKSVGDSVSIPGLGRSPEKEVATHSSILAWRITWTEAPSRLHKVNGVTKNQTRLKWLSLQGVFMFLCLLLFEEAGNYKQGEKTILRMGEDNSKQSKRQRINLKNIQATPATQFQKNKWPNQKMGQRTKQTFLQGRHTDG